MGSWSKAYLELARRASKLRGEYKPQNGDPKDWDRPIQDAYPAFCQECGDAAADLYVMKGDTRLRLCARCADKIDVACEGCGIPIPATSNVDGHPYCALCYQREGAKRRAAGWPELGECGFCGRKIIPKKTTASSIMVCEDCYKAHAPLPAAPDAFPTRPTPLDRARELVNRAKNQKNQ